MPQNDKPETVITINAGDDLEIENQNGPVKIKVLIVRYDQDGGAKNEELAAGTTVAQAVGGVDRHQEVTVNGERAAADRELRDGDKVAVSPDNPEGGC